MSRHRIRPAPTSARLLATAVDAVAALLVLGGLVASALAAVRLLERSMPDPRDWNVDRFNRRLAPAMRTATVLARNVRSPGQMAAGIRRVDARTGGPVTMRSAVIRLLTELASQRVSRAILAPAKRRMEREQATAQAEIERVRDAHPDDPDAVTEAYERRELTPSVIPCGAFALRSLAFGSIMPLTSLLSPTGQTLADRLSATVLVRSR